MLNKDKEEHEKELQKLHREELQMTEIRFETETSVPRNKVTCLEKEKYQLQAEVNEMRSQLTHANDNVIDQNKDAKDYKEQASNLAVNLKEETDKRT